MRLAKKAQAQQNKPRKHCKNIYIYINQFNVHVCEPLLCRELAFHGESQEVVVVKGEDNDDKKDYSATYHTGGHDHSQKGKRKEVPFVFEVCPSFRCYNLLKKNMSYQQISVLLPIHNVIITSDNMSVVILW